MGSHEPRPGTLAPWARTSQLFPQPIKAIGQLEFSRDRNVRLEGRALHAVWKVVILEVVHSLD